MLNGLDLFSGIAGIGIALSPWVRTIAYCEADRYAQAVLLSRMESGEIDRAPIWDDVRTLKGDMLPRIDIISGGFPCQDVSTAGLRKGMEGERSILYLEAVRLVRECKPKFVFLENVQGIRKFVPSIRGEFEAIGYDCRDGFLSAAEVGAPHARNRWWLLAHTDSKRGRIQQEFADRKSSTNSNNNGSKESLADASSEGLQRHGDGRESDKTITHAKQSISGGNHWSRDWWATEPNVGRVVDGLPFRVDRIKCLGNSVVPLQAREAFKILMGLN